MWKTETTPEYEGHSNISLVHMKRKYLLNISFDVVQLSIILREYHRIIDRINKNTTHISLYSLFRCYGHLCINMIGSWLMLQGLSTLAWFSLIGLFVIPRDPLTIRMRKLRRFRIINVFLVYLASLTHFLHHACLHGVLQQEYI